MTTYYWGCDRRRSSWPSYAERCNAFEYEPKRGKRGPESMKALNRWRVGTPRGFAFTVRAAASVAASIEAASGRDAALGDDFARAWAETEARAKALAAKAVLVRAGMGLMPGEASRRVIAQVASIAAASGRALAWELSGPWDPVSTRDWLASIGAMLVVDPFTWMREGHGAGGGQGAFVVTERAGARRGFDRYDFAEMQSWASGLDRAFVYLRGHQQWTHAGEFGAALQSA